MQARYYFHPVRHQIVADYFKSVRDRSRANNMLLHLSDALVRSSMFDTRKLSAIGMSDDADFEVHRIRISPDKYPALYRLYTSSPSRLRGYIFGEVLAEAARFRSEKPDEAGMLIMNLGASLEDVGEDAYPSLPETMAAESKSDQSRPQEGTENDHDSEDGINGLKGNIVEGFMNY